MKPNWLRHALAHGFALSTCGSAVLLASLAGWQLLPPASLLRDLPLAFWLYFFCAIVVTLPLGWFLGGLIVWPFVGVFTGKLNGAPFRSGEFVHVLSGAHRDRVLEVYAVWHERHQVQAWIDEQHRKEVTDVFSYHEVCRAPARTA